MSDPNIQEPAAVKEDFIVNDDGSITVDDITIPPAPIPALTVEATKERLIITALAVRDFKSYAGEHIIGPYNKNFSCIVGPNGSGKSNVIDSLLFVFGYRAQKIRSKKVSVLIHKSHKYPDLSSCSVTVKFATIKDEGDKYTILPGSEFSVTRNGYKDNSSTYEINGRRAQYKDVGILLRKYGIDLDYNRFMILQGEIELISMMKPKGTEQDAGMLEYIEDIIGSHRFIKPLEHFHTKAEEVNEIRIEKLNQLKIVEKERADAEKPRNKAMEYLQLANKVALMENSVLQVQIRDATEEEEKLNDGKELLIKKIDELSTSVDSLQSEKEKKEMELRDIISEFEDRTKTVEEYKQEFTELERTDAACRENIKNNKEKQKKLSKSLETEETKIGNLRNQPEVLKKEIEELLVKKESLEAVREEEENKLTEVMGAVKDEIKEFQDEKDSLETELVELKDVVNEKKSEMDLAQSELDLILSSEKKEKENLEILQRDYDKINSLIKEEELTLKTANERVPTLIAQITSEKGQLIAKEKEEISLIDEIKSRRIKLDEANSSLSASQNRSTLVNAFLEEKKKGRLTGVYGRLGDLGAIDLKYDVAISTACGPLDNIVTDTMTTAQECVEFLKKNNLGYATFIALDQMKKWEPYTKQKISTPENVPRLFDLITVKDADVLTAFYYALGDTLVANDLDQATRVGLQGATRHRIVTLKGELIDLAGTMSGGGGKAFKGRMGNSVADNNFTPAEVKLMEQNIENLVKELSLLKKSILDLKESIDKKEKEVSNLQHSVKKSKLNFDGYVEQEKMLQKQIDEQKVKIVEVAPDKQKIIELEAQIQKHEKNYSEATNAASVIETKVKGLQEQIMSVTKGKYGAAQKKIDKITKEIDHMSQGISKNTALLKNTDKNLKKAEAKIASLKEDLELCERAMEKFKNEFKALESKGTEVANKKKEAEDFLLIIQTQKALATGQVKEISSKIHEIKSEIIELKNKNKMLDIDVRANKGKIRNLKEKLSKLELYDIDDGQTELPKLSAQELDDVPVSSEEYEIGKLKAQIKDMNPDLGAIAEFKKKEEMYRAKLKSLEETIAERDHYRQQFENLRQHRLQEFMRGFSIITLKVKELYQMMTLGGDAELELVDSVDPFSEGIEFSVRPLRKSWKSIRNLSGGEKTLSSLSLVFALHYYRSTPFFVMDEIDAALDFRNVSIIGSYIKDCTKNAQFIVISLRENMFMQADHLIGIYKTNNRTKNVYISPPKEADKAVSKEADTRKAAEQKQDTSFDKLLNEAPNENRKKRASFSTVKDVQNEEEKSDGNAVRSINKSQNENQDKDACFDILNESFEILINKARMENQNKAASFDSSMNKSRKKSPGAPFNNSDLNGSFEILMNKVHKENKNRAASFESSINQSRKKSPGAPFNISDTSFNILLNKVQHQDKQTGIVHGNMVNKSQNKSQGKDASLDISDTSFDILLNKPQPEDKSSDSPVNKTQPEDKVIDNSLNKTQPEDIDQLDNSNQLVCEDEDYSPNNSSNVRDLCEHKKSDIRDDVVDKNSSMLSNEDASTNIHKRLSVDDLNNTFNDSSISECMNISNNDKSSKSDLSNSSKSTASKRKLDDITSSIDWSDDDDFVIPSPNAKKSF